jgi:hypothetical protein
MTLRELLEARPDQKALAAVREWDRKVEEHRMAHHLRDEAVMKRRAALRIVGGTDFDKTGASD